MTYNALINSNTTYNTVFIGCNRITNIKDNFAFYESGYLSEDFISALYSNCELVIFPSQYEGFGFPVMQAIQREKQVIVYDNDINQELKALNHAHSEFIFFFNEYSKINSLIDEVLSNKKILNNSYPLRNWRNVIIETEKVINKTLVAEPDIHKLQHRFMLINQIGYYLEHRRFIEIMSPFIVFLSKFINKIINISFYNFIIKRTLKKMLRRLKR